MKVSPFVTKKTKNPHPSPALKKPVKNLDKKYGTEIRQMSGHKIGQISNGNGLDKLLLDKFPGFDPAWPDEVKIKWFAAFDELLKRTGA
jgi:hypothetical protein